MKLRVMKRKWIAACFFTVMSALLAASCTFAAIVKNPIVDKASEISTWDCVWFGSYPQGPQGQVKPIKWRVLQVIENDNEKTALLLSDVALDQHPFDSAFSTNKWSKSDIRSWMNDDNDGFYNKAFSAGEKAAIRQSSIRTPVDDPVNCNVFLLALDDVQNAGFGFQNNEARKCKASLYAIGKGVYVNNFVCSWWLRTPGSSTNFAASVNDDGSVSNLGDEADWSHDGVRPALILNLQSDLWSYAGTVDSTGKAVENKDIAECTIDSISPVTYNTKPQTPKIVVTDNGTVLEEGKDYSVSYTNNIDAGEATAAASGIGMYYTGTKEVRFQIQKLSVTQTNTTLSQSSAAFTGAPIQPTVTVTYENAALTAGKDYTVSYKNNINVGTATVTITGIGSCEGEKTLSFEITEAKEQVTPLLIAAGKQSGKSAVKISWASVPGAQEYSVYGSKYGSKKMKLLGTTGSTSFKAKKLKANGIYSFSVTAAVSGKTITSPTISVAMSKAKKANATGIKVKTSSLILKQNQSAKIKASLKKKGKKALVKQGSSIRYYSSNESVASVNKKGKVTPTGKGSCTIYAVAANGLNRTIQVTVTD